ncbi:putative germin-like protein 2-1 [Tanacetum coccineum]
MVRIDYTPWGLNPPHTHPRATEILTVLEGSLQVGFVTSNPDNRHISKVLQKGDVFVFPVGLVHYQRNVGNGNAVVIAALSSQNPGAITIANAVFGANPSIPSDILARAFQVDKSVVDQLQAKELNEMSNKLILFSIVALTLAVPLLALVLEPATYPRFLIVCVSEPNSSGMSSNKSVILQVQAEDFFFSGLHLRGNTSNAVGSRVTPVFATQLPGLNALGISMVRIDYAPWGLNPPHTHPRATEILTVLEGSLQVGFVTSNPDNRHISKVLQKGDVFVFPVGLVHYQHNVGKGNAVVIAALSSQNPGAIKQCKCCFFWSKAFLHSADILARAFQVDNSLVAQLQAKF